MKELVSELEKDVRLLESWIKNTEHGGWSTQNLSSMKDRLNELKAFLYDFNRYNTI